MKFSTQSLTTLGFFSFSILTASSAITPRTAPKSQIFVSNFDNIATTALGPPADIPKPYDGLYFNGVRANRVTVPLVEVNPQSTPNLVSSSTLKRILNGTPPPNITSLYKGSKVTSFTLKDLFIGCSIAATGSVSVPGVDPPLPAEQVPQPCAVSFSGIKKTGSVSVQKTCNFGGGTKLAPCDFKDVFKDVVFVQFEAVSALALPASTVIILDNVRHENNY